MIPEEIKEIQNVILMKRASGEVVAEFDASPEAVAKAQAKLDAEIGDVESTLDKGMLGSDICSNDVLQNKDNLVCTDPITDESEQANKDINNTSTTFYQKDTTSISSQFRRGSTPHIKTIMNLLKVGWYPARIAKLMGKSKSFVHYYVKKLEKMGYIEKEESLKRSKNGDYIKKFRGAFVTYRITQAGSNFLAGIEKGVVGPRLRLHNVYFKYPILSEPELPIEWLKVELQNWTQLVGTELGMSVRKNPGSIEIVCRAVEGDNPFELLLLARDEADDLATYLEAKFRMGLGRPTMSRKPHFGVYDPVAGTISRYYELSTNKGRIDSSLGRGEVDWFSPYTAAEYLEMPGRVRRLEQNQMTLLEGQLLFSDGMKQHMLLISDLQEVARALFACARALAGKLQEEV